jgi:hypothetical protein
MGAPLVDHPAIFSFWKVPDHHFARIIAKLIRQLGGLN